MNKQPFSIYIHLKRKQVMHGIRMCLSFAFVFILVVSCSDKEDEKAAGTVVFGANYHVINCISNVDVFVDGKHLGQLEIPADSIPDCERNYGIREELTIGHHDYKVEIRPEIGTGCTADIYGELNIEENECETVFIDYREIDWN